jgi:hypothetical protein
MQTLISIKYYQIALLTLEFFFAKVIFSPAKMHKRIADMHESVGNPVSLTTKVPSSRNMHPRSTLANKCVEEKKVALKSRIDPFFVSNIWKKFSCSASGEEGGCCIVFWTDLFSRLTESPNSFFRRFDVH